MTEPLIRPVHGPAARRTERLVLRQWREDDREPFAAMNADPEVMRHFPTVLDREASDAVLDRLRAGRRGAGVGTLGRRTGRHRAAPGFTGLAVPRHPLPFMPCVEVGWRLTRPAWGHGFATEAAREALRVGFDELGLDEVVSFTAVDNTRSRRGHGAARHDARPGRRLRPPGAAGRRPAAPARALPPRPAPDEVTPSAAAATGGRVR